MIFFVKRVIVIHISSVHLTFIQCKDSDLGNRLNLTNSPENKINKITNQLINVKLDLIRYYNNFSSCPMSITIRDERIGPKN